MVKRRLSGFQKPVDTGERKQVNLARVTYDGMWVNCSCGWVFGHIREKVREDRIDRHINEKHDGRGIRL